MKRSIFSTIVILIYLNALILTAFSESGVQACNGKAFPLFTTVYNGKIYVSKSADTGNLLKSRTTLYAIDTQELTAQRIFSTRNHTSTRQAMTNRLAVWREKRTLSATMKMLSLSPADQCFTFSGSLQK